MAQVKVRVIEYIMLVDILSDSNPHYKAIRESLHGQFYSDSDMQMVYLHRVLEHFVKCVPNFSIINFYEKHPNLSGDIYVDLGF